MAQRRKHSANNGHVFFLLTYKNFVITVVDASMFCLKIRFIKINHRCNEEKNDRTVVFINRFIVYLVNSKRGGIFLNGSVAFLR